VPWAARGPLVPPRGLLLVRARAGVRRTGPGPPGSSPTTVGHGAGPPRPPQGRAGTGRAVVSEPASLTVSTSTATTVKTRLVLLWVYTPRHLAYYVGSIANSTTSEGLAILHTQTVFTQLRETALSLKILSS